MSPTIRCYARQIDLLFHMGCNWKNADVALLILALISFALPLIGHGIGKEDVTHVKCYTTCLAAVRTGAVVATPLAISAAGFGAAGIVVGPFEARFMIAQFAARYWFAFLQSAGVYGVGTTDKMVLASNVSPLCAAICVQRKDKIEIEMLLEKALWILAFNVVSLTSEVYGLDWPWNWTKRRCYMLLHLFSSTGGFGAAGIVAGSLAAKIMSMIGVVKAGGWFAFLQSVGVTGVGTTGKMVLASTVSPLCAAICGSAEEIQDLKCNTHRINGMKGLDENVLKAEIVNKIEECEGLCNNEKECKAFRYLLKNRVCFVYNSNLHIEDNISESQFYVKRCLLCYMKTTKNVKGPDDEIESIRVESSIKECEKYCIKSDDCRAVHFDGERCFKFTNEVKPYEKTGMDFSRRICEQYTN
ncbi:unnamed protein product [Mytilus edulis]|uniref:Apple domain-containing protein n=1 Tax=Mytilus edulis TaxID=6550 RepID=A0A8S3UQ92_MYTED|nr:unnamed protein product [Mytilus edulis]